MEQAGSKGKGNGSRPKSATDEAPQRPRVTAIVAVALAACLLIWLLFIKGGDDDSPAPEAAPAAKEVTLVSEAGLLPAMKGVGYPVYWAGPRVGVKYEVSRPEGGRTYVRYLPKGVKAGSGRQFLTVGSYEQEDAIDNIRELGQKPGGILIQIPGGGSAYAEGPQATSAYLAFPGVNTQIEVFDPQGGEALRLIRSGAIVPVS